MLYALHHAETPNTYVFMERYTDRAAVDAHRATDYFKTLGRKMGASTWTAARRSCGCAQWSSRALISQRPRDVRALTREEAPC
jgi:hypothetical protein